MTDTALEATSSNSFASREYTYPFRNEEIWSPVLQSLGILIP
jgi:hypothetical protein